MAHLKKRNNTWFAVWSQNGKRVVKSTSVKVEGDLAASKLKRLALSTAQSMEAAAKGSLTMDAALDAVRGAALQAGVISKMPTVLEYFSSYEPSGASQNVSNSKRAVVRFLDFAKSEHHTKLDVLPVAVCREWLCSELARVSVGTVDNYKKSLSAAFNAAIRDEVLSRNPFALIRLADLKKSVNAVIPSLKREPFSMEELQLMLREFGYPWREMVLISYLTGGQRIGDVACLKWSSVDFERGFISFSAQKTGAVITAPMVEPLRECLLALHKEREGYQSFVLPTMAERYNRASGTLSTEFTGMLRGLGIIPPLAAFKQGVRGARRSVSPKSFHSIRHAVVSMLRSSNVVSADLARAIVGHESEEIERQYFSASHDDKLRGLSLLAGAIE